MHLATISWDWLIQEIQHPLVIFGFTAQFIFFMRFAVQWIASERRGRSHIPIAFWYLSITGGLMTLVYAALRKDIVFMTAQALSVMIYVRNLMLIYGRRAEVAARRGQRRPAVLLDSDRVGEPDDDAAARKQTPPNCPPPSQRGAGGV